MANYNNISLSSLTSGQSINLTSLDFDFQDNSHIKKYQTYETDEDLLALSVAWQRLRNARRDDPTAPYPGITRLLDKELFRYVTDSDRTRANTIRDFYSKKIMMWRLKNHRFSKYRDDMNQFVHSDGKIFKEEMCPLAYRLPEFYDYDSAFDDMIKNFNHIVTQPSQHQHDKKSLTLVKTFAVGKKYNKRKEYWFSDENNNLVNMSIDQTNVLIPLLDSFVTKPIMLEAIYSKKERDDKEHLVANKFKFG